MKIFALLIGLCLMFVTACGPPKSSGFLSSFDPAVTLSTVGTAESVTYFNNSKGMRNQGDSVRGVRIERNWTFTFHGSHAQLSKQLGRFRAEVERQLSSSGCNISGRGEWSGDFSGFGFDYSSRGIEGFIRVTGVSLESGNQGLEILVYEH